MAKSPVTMLKTTAIAIMDDVFKVKDESDETNEASKFARASYLCRCETLYCRSRSLFRTRILHPIQVQYRHEIVWLRISVDATCEVACTIANVGETRRCS